MTQLSALCRRSWHTMWLSHLEHGPVTGPPRSCGYVYELGQGTTRAFGTSEHAYMVMPNCVDEYHFSIVCEHLYFGYAHKYHVLQYCSILYTVYVYTSYTLYQEGGRRGQAQHIVPSRTRRLLRTSTPSRTDAPRLRNHITTLVCSDLGQQCSVGCMLLLRGTYNMSLSCFARKLTGLTLSGCDGAYRSAFCTLLYIKTVKPRP